jgi:hypothetical protein
MSEFAEIDVELDAWRAAGLAPRFWLRDEDATEPCEALERLIALTRKYSPTGRSTVASTARSAARGAEPLRPRRLVPSKAHCRPQDRAPRAPSSLLIVRIDHVITCLVVRRLSANPAGGRAARRMPPPRGSCPLAASGVSAVRLSPSHGPATGTGLRHANPT